MTTIKISKFSIEISATQYDQDTHWDAPQRSMRALQVILQDILHLSSLISGLFINQEGWGLTMMGSLQLLPSGFLAFALQHNSILTLV